MMFRFHFACAALCALLLGAGCGDRGATTIAEMDEAFYIQGVQLNKQGRSGEALTAFLKVIDKRGERGAPESHLEAGVIYLNHTKEPVLAYYHFKRYLELQANSKEAPRVRSMLDAALRDIARRFPGRPADDPSGRVAAAEEIAKLRRDNDELRAELQTLRGGGAMQTNRAARVITLPEEVRTQPVAQAPSSAPSTIVAAPPTPQTRAAGASVVPVQPQTQRPPPSAVTKATPVRPSPASSQTRPATGGSGRTHTVQPKQTLYAIAKQYNVRLEDLAKANGITNPSNVPAGTVLRIP